MTSGVQLLHMLRKAPERIYLSLDGDGRAAGAGATGAGVIGAGVTGADVTGAGVTGAGMTGANQAVIALVSPASSLTVTRWDFGV